MVSELIHKEFQMVDGCQYLHVDYCQLLLVLLITSSQTAVSIQASLPLSFSSLSYYSLRIKHICA